MNFLVVEQIRFCVKLLLTHVTVIRFHLQVNFIHVFRKLVPPQILLFAKATSLVASLVTNSEFYDMSLQVTIKIPLSFEDFSTVTRLVIVTGLMSGQIHIVNNVSATNVT